MTEAEHYRFWRASVINCGSIALVTGLVRSPGFWSSYVLDIVGPAWIYILIRGRFSKAQPAMLGQLLSPEGALAITIAACFLAEAAQYYRLYEATFDPLDFIAYMALLAGPIF